MNRPDLSARLIGSERHPIVTVDNFHPDPTSLRTAANAAAFTRASRHYPGIRGILPADYLGQVNPAIATALRDVFGYTQGVRLLDASFSIVTVPPDQLSVAQRLPHVDAVEPARIALVHYLSLDDLGGTAFYRHRATGFEAIDAARSPRYLAQLNRELAQRETLASAYMAGDNALFEQIGHVDARFNRAVIYRSQMLHSGIIAPETTLSDDPTTGRLTVTAFLSAR